MARNSKMEMGDSIAIKFGDNVVVSFDKDQIIYLMLISKDTNEHANIIEFASGMISNEIITSIINLVKRRAAFINSLGLDPSVNEKKILGTLHTMALVLEVLN